MKSANSDFKRIELAEDQKADTAKWVKVIKTADTKLD
jgi:hypothetical protein